MQIGMQGESDLSILFRINFFKKIHQTACPSFFHFMH